MNMRHFECTLHGFSKFQFPATQNCLHQSAINHHEMLLGLLIAKSAALKPPWISPLGLIVFSSFNWIQALTINRIDLGGSHCNFRVTKHFCIFCFYPLSGLIGVGLAPHIVPLTIRDGFLFTFVGICFLTFHNNTWCFLLYVQILVILLMYSGMATESMCFILCRFQTYHRNL